jgi:hypothetical protein
MIRTQPVQKHALQYIITHMTEFLTPETSLSALKDDMGQAANDLIHSDLLLKSSPSQTLWIAGENDDDECVELEWDDSIKRHVYYDRFSGNWWPAPIDDITNYKLNFTSLLQQIGHALNIENDPVMLVDHLLWDLGDYQIGSRKIPILFARRIHCSETLSVAYPALTNRVGRSEGIILTSTKQPLKYISLPGNHQVLPLTDCIKMDSEFFQLDTDIIEGLFKIQTPTTSKQKFECHANGARIIVNHNHKDSQEFTFRGKQKQCVEYLYQKWVDGHKIVQIDKMFNDLEDFEKTKRLPNLFKGNKHWKALIAFEGKQCWLIDD